MHADYRCRHAGACCTAGWAIPAEAAVVHAVQAHFPRSDSLFVTGGSSPDEPPIVAHSSSGACVFFDESGGRLCAIHRRLGQEHLPSACRHFPRVAMTDERGTFISLSHFCPTAAAMLFSERPLRRIRAPVSLSLNGDIEGLDARGVLPPLLRAGMLTDVEGYDTWESRAIDTLARDDLSPDQALDFIEIATRDVETWRPGCETLARRVCRAFEQPKVPPNTPPAFDDAARRLTLARAAVPAGLMPPDDDPVVTDGWPPAVGNGHDNRAIRRYLAARLFGNWIAYNGHGLRAVVEGLRVHLAVLRMKLVTCARAATSPQSDLIEAIRATDLLLVHYAEPRTLARLIDVTA
jgi:Fe-S-cluster containining protein